MAPPSTQKYQIDRYTIEWLAYKREHWEPEPSEKLLDDLVAMGEHRLVLRMLLGATTATHKFEKLPWIVRVHSEIREQRVSLDAIKAQNLLKSGHIEDEREETKVCEVSSFPPNIEFTMQS